MTLNTPADDGQKVLPPQIFCDDEHVAVSARRGDVSVRACLEAVAALLRHVVVLCVFERHTVVTLRGYCVHAPNHYEHVLSRRMLADVMSR